MTLLAQEAEIHLAFGLPREKIRALAPWHYDHHLEAARTVLARYAVRL